MTTKKRPGRSSGNPARPTRSQPPVDEGAGIIWLKTEPNHEGNGYVVTLDASDDISVTLTPERAVRHAQGVLAAAHRAAYDASVARQMTRGFGLTIEDATGLLEMLRDDRPPLDPEDTMPLLLIPGVNREMKPFLDLHVNGEHRGQWDVDHAEKHAIGVLSTVGIADLDSGYYRMLVGQFLQIDDSQARQSIDDLRNFREELL